LLYRVVLKGQMLRSISDGENRLVTMPQQRRREDPY
jgi:hypothetical protein